MKTSRQPKEPDETKQKGRVAPVEPTGNTPARIENPAQSSSASVADPNTPAPDVPCTSHPQRLANIENDTLGRNSQGATFESASNQRSADTTVAPVNEVSDTGVLPQPAATSDNNNLPTGFLKPLGNFVNIAHAFSTGFPVGAVSQQMIHPHAGRAAAVAAGTVAGAIATLGNDHVRETVEGIIINAVNLDFHIPNEVERPPSPGEEFTGLPVPRPPVPVTSPTVEPIGELAGSNPESESQAMPNDQPTAKGDPFA